MYFQHNYIFLVCIVQSGRPGGAAAGAGALGPYSKKGTEIGKEAGAQQWPYSKRLLQHCCAAAQLLYPLHCPPRPRGMIRRTVHGCG